MLISVQNGGLPGGDRIAETYARIKAAGFEAVDWNIDHAWSPLKVQDHADAGDCIFFKSMEEIEAYWKPHIDGIRAAGLAFGQAHAPFPAYSTADPAFIDKAIEVYKNCIKLCDKVGCPNLVIHGICTRMADERLLPEQTEELNLKLYRSLIPTLQQTHVTVCLENLFSGAAYHRIPGHCAYAPEAVEIIDLLNAEAGKECFGLCLDVGHLCLMHGDFRTYIGTLGKRIKCLHLHDNDGVDDKHLAPYTGNIPWEVLCRELKKAGYDGNLNFETFAQVLPGRIPDALADEFLRHIAEIGKYFRTQILG